MNVRPLDGTPLEVIVATDVSELPALVKRARTAQKGWRDTSVYDRIKALSPLKKRILENAEKIAKTVSDEVGKPETEALLAEALPSADVLDYWCGIIEELLEPEEVDLDPISYPGKSGVTTREARGVVAVIMPWNFPIALPLRTLVPALLAGNAVVFKPSEVTPRSGKLLAELFEGLLPKDVFQVVQGDREIGAALVDSDIDLVVFTGSVAAGKKIAHACAERLIPSALELGGKDPAIVLEDADLQRAANGVVWGALGNAGQNCAAIERVYVAEKVAAAFTEKVVTLVKSLTANDVGPLATKAQQELVIRHVEEAVANGAKILVGGKAGERFAYEPTVIAVENEDIALMKDETFGPVLPIVIVKDDAEAIERANGTRYGLTASVWTKDRKRAQRIARELRAGVVTINNHSFTGALPMTPWSGVGETGWGVTNSSHSLDMMTRPRFVLTDKNGAKSEMWWYPYTPALRAIAVALTKIKGGAGIGDRIGAIFTLLRSFPKRLGGG